jgi:hypothetical protein
VVAREIQPSSEPGSGAVADIAFRHNPEPRAQNLVSHFAIPRGPQPSNNIFLLLAVFHAPLRLATQNEHG